MLPQSSTGVKSYCLSKRQVKAWPFQCIVCFIQSVTQCLISCVSIMYKLTNSCKWKTLPAIGLSPTKLSQNDLLGIWKVYTFFFSIIFHFHSFLYFWILARTEAEVLEYRKTGYSYYCCILSNLESPSLERKGILISLLTQFCRPRQLEK